MFATYYTKQDAKWTSFPHPENYYKILIQIK